MERPDQFKPVFEPASLSTFARIPREDVQFMERKTGINAQRRLHAAFHESFVLQVTEVCKFKLIAAR